ncbi:MAG TPA: endo-1,4-beta-xylanase [Anaerolineales bacterium]|nr:endo-1,4-beta-xylanase [Anaerolineales bacterium]
MKKHRKKTLENITHPGHPHRILIARSLCLIGFFIVSCTTPLPTETAPSPVITTPVAAPSPLGTPDSAPSHTFPNCSPAIFPYRTIDALPYFINPNFESRQPTLANLAKKHDIRIGTAVSANLLKDEAYAVLLSNEFNMVTPEVDMKWENIHPEPDRFDFTKGDTIVAFAQIHQMALYGHVLVWDLQLPAWVTQGQFTRDQWIDLLCTHIKSVVGHYRGKIYAWDVVNEALDESGKLRNTIWLQNIGPEYIAMAFHWAHEADPSALLVYNDFMAEGMNQKSQAVYALVQGLLRQNVPIDAVGLQMHVGLNSPPTFHALSENMQRLSELGLSVYITEMDVKLQYSTRNTSEKLSAQSRVYRHAIAACINAPNCRGFSTWGLTDRYSWIPDYTGNEDAPLLFDVEGQPKPAYFAIIDLLQTP